MSNFFEIGLYACDECSAVKIVKDPQPGNVNTRVLSCVCQPYNQLVPHSPVCIDFTTRRFVVPEYRRRSDDR